MLILVGLISALLAGQSLESQVIEEAVLMIGRPIAMSDSFVSYDIVCPEDIDKPCGAITLSGIQKKIDMTNGVYDFTATTRLVADDASCIARNVVYQGRSVEGFDQPVDPSSDNTPYLFVAVEHDPIPAGQCTGRFADVNLIGLRCELEVKKDNQFDVTRFCAIPLR